mmetsp:Transcript_24756/g.60950  ORF Transcript_24756/g.60950 Transcript_24756/m.60950 type:complete len:231 (+) Transcript_24756:416-1108(+)
MALRYSRALNSSLPFSFSFIAIHFFSCGLAPRIAFSVRSTSTEAPGSDMSSSGASGSSSSPPFIIRCALAMSSEVGMRMSCSSSSSSLFFFLRGTGALLKVVVGTLRMGTPPPLRGRTSVGSSALLCSSCFSSSVQVVRSSTKALTSRLVLARTSGSLSRSMPRELMRPRTTLAVWGNPSASMYCMSFCSCGTSCIELISSRLMSSNFLLSSSVSFTLFARIVDDPEGRR